MTKEEIKALVAAKIAGQGSAIDSASVLPDILNGIVDLIPAEPAPAPTPGEMLSALTLNSSVNFVIGKVENKSGAEMASALGFQSETDLYNLFSGNYIRVAFADRVMSIVLNSESEVVFGYYTDNSEYLGHLLFEGDDVYNYTGYEV